jgi:hypothetical protein
MEVLMPNDDWLPIASRFRAVLIYVLTTIICIFCLELAWFLATGMQDTHISPTWKTAKMVLDGGLDHIAIFMISAMISGLLTISGLLAEISARLRLRR